MLQVVALTYNELAPVLPIGRCLPPEGGTIGRDSDNAVVLPDPMRLVSRRHLQVARESDGSYWLANISESNPALVNDSSLEPGSRRPLVVGDEVRVGCYLLQVREAVEGGTDGASVLAADAAQPAAAAIDAGLLEMLGEGALPVGAAPAAERDEAFAPDLALPAPEAGSPVTAEAPFPPPPILDPEPESLDIDRILDLKGAGGVSRGFGLEVGQHIELADLDKDKARLIRDAVRVGDGVEQMTADPLMGGAAAMEDPSLDPLQLFRAGRDEERPFDLLESASDSRESHGINHRAELNSPFQLPVMLEDPAAPEAARGGAVQPPPAPVTIPDDLELDELVHGTTGARSAGPPGVSPARPAEPRPPAAAPLVEPAPPPPPRQAAAAAPAPAPVRAGTSADPSADALYRALLEGLAVEALQDRKGLDEDFMRLIGTLLRQSVEGAVRLMTARATVKREVRANVTLIAPERNNPLKFSPDGRVALMYLLGRRYPGFMEADEAVQEAFADLYDHQVGVLAGMRSALSHVFERFDPETISRNANDHGVIESILAVGRKARLWDAYGRYFENTRDQAIDRFQDFFGAVFVDAYEEASAKADGQKQRERQG
ncbi:type VI secretion system-associated FHA domain protein TagH [Thauera sp. AutoDN2]|uniref:type VI secretion system-associated FHA domain protein TagH n=1 Tax=Thauera sp. AutoDN2 TaxID=3416051 RepID=UPI003F4BF343